MHQRGGKRGIEVVLIDLEKPLAQGRSPSAFALASISRTTKSQNFWAVFAELTHMPSLVKPQGARVLW